MAHIAFSPDGRRLARLTTGNLGLGNVAPPSFRPGFVEMWDVATGNKLFTVTDLKGMGNGLAFVHDGRELAIASGDRVNLLDVGTGRHLREVSGFSGSAWGSTLLGIAYDPSGRRLAAVDGQGVQLRDADTDQELLVLRGSYNTVAFSADGNLLIAGNARDVTVWDARPLPPEPPPPPPQPAPRLRTPCRPAARACARRPRQRTGAARTGRRAERPALVGPRTAARP